MVVVAGVWWDDDQVRWMVERKDVDGMVIGQLGVVLCVTGSQSHIYCTMLDLLW